MQAEELKEAEEAQHLQLAQHRVRRQYQHQHHTRYQYRASPSTRVGSQRILPWCPRLRICSPCTATEFVWNCSPRQARASGGRGWGGRGLPDEV